MDHGIESPEARRLAGKQAEGQITLRAARSDGQIVVDVEDDGRGIDWEAVRTSGEAKGVPTA